MLKIMTVQLQKKKRLKKHGLFRRMARRNPFLSESSSFWFAKLYLSKLQPNTGDRHKCLMPTVSTVVDV